MNQEQPVQARDADLDEDHMLAKLTDGDAIMIVFRRDDGTFGVHQWLGGGQADNGEIGGDFRSLPAALAFAEKTLRLELFYSAYEDRIGADAREKYEDAVLVELVVRLADEFQVDHGDALGYC